MKNIAFIYTEYHQNILFAVCLQTNITLDIVFIRSTIAKHHDMHMFAKKVIVLQDIPFSWRSIGKYYQEYKKSILPYIDLTENHRVFTWSTEHPLVRFTLNKIENKEVNLLEDGAGSYVKRGLFDLRLKDYLVTILIDSIIDFISLKVKSYNRAQFRGWSLYANCFPDFEIKKNLIEHQCFQKAMLGSMKEDQVGFLETGSVVFIQQPYVEMGILKEEEYIDIHKEAVLKLKEYFLDEQIKIIWKLHPRTDMNDEEKRIKKLKRDTGIEFEIVKEQWNMEQLAYVNRQHQLRYFSLGSSSLYVILALSDISTPVYLIENEQLKQKLTTQIQVNDFYSSIGIRII